MMPQISAKLFVLCLLSLFVVQICADPIEQAVKNVQGFESKVIEPYPVISISYNMEPGQEMKFTFAGEEKALAVKYANNSQPPSFCKIFPPTTTLEGPTPYKISNEDTISDFIVVGSDIYVLTKNLMLMRLEVVTRDEFGRKMQYTVIKDRTFRIQEIYGDQLKQTECKFIKYRRMFQRILLNCAHDVLIFMKDSIKEVGKIQTFKFGEIRKVEMEFNILMAIKPTGIVEVYDLTSVLDPVHLTTIDAGFLGVDKLDIIEAYYKPVLFTPKNGQIFLLDRHNGIFTVNVYESKRFEYVQGSHIPEENGYLMAISGMTLLLASSETVEDYTTYKFKEYFLTISEGTKGATLNQFFTTEEEITGMHMKDFTHDAIVWTPRSQYLYRHSIPKYIQSSPFNEVPLQSKKNLFKIATTDALEVDFSDVTIGADSNTLYVWNLKQVTPHMSCKPGLHHESEWTKFSLYFYKGKCKNTEEYCLEKWDIDVNVGTSFVYKVAEQFKGPKSTIILVVVLVVACVIMTCMAITIIKYRREIKDQVEKMSQPKEMRYNEIHKTEMDKTALGLGGKRNDTTFDIDEQPHHTPDVNEIMKEKVFNN